MTRYAAVSLDRRMLVNKRPLLVCVTLDARCICSCRQPCLFELKTAVRVMAIAALHRAFQHFVMERQIELVLRLAVTTETKLRFAISEEPQVGYARLLCVRFRYKYVRGC